MTYLEEHQPELVNQPGRVARRIEPPLDPSLDDAPDRRQYQIPERDGKEVFIQSRD